VAERAVLIQEWLADEDARRQVDKLRGELRASNERKREPKNHAAIEENNLHGPSKPGSVLPGLLANPHDG
jgi:hypothetical protein